MNALRNLFIDFNSYFSSCEQHLEPRLRGRPVVVTPVVTGSGCCIAASYEARAYGIRVGTRVAEARQLCRDVEVAEARPDLYIRLHHQLRSIIESCMYVDRVYSVDEMSCPLTGQWRRPDKALELAELIKTRLAEFSPALRCSIGISMNSWLAKMGTELQKPNGLVLLQPEDLPGRLLHLKLTDLHGISKNMEARLRRHGILSVEALYQQPIERMRQIWGSIEGERYFYYMHGHDLEVQETGNRSNIGHSRVLPPKRRTLSGVRSTLFRLLQRAAIRLRAEGFLAARLSASVSFFGLPTWHSEVKLAATQDTRELIHALQVLWERFPHYLWRGRFSKCALVFSDLLPVDQSSLPLFAEEAAHTAALNNALDAVTRHYGQRALYYACAWGGFDDNQPARIPFARIPNLAYEN